MVALALAVRYPRLRDSKAIITARAIIAVMKTYRASDTSSAEYWLKLLYEVVCRSQIDEQEEEGAMFSSQKCPNFH